MEHDPEISLRQAAAAFGPCAGGTENALLKIIDKLEDDEMVWRKFVGNRAKMRSDIIAMETSDWFRNYSSLSDQHPIGTDVDFDKFRDEVERVLYQSDELVLDYDQVRSIWFPKDLSKFIPNAELASTWSFTQALAWVATKDLRIVGAIDHLHDIEPTGWLAVLLSERCEKCEKLAATPQWQQCNCLTNAFTSLCVTSLPEALESQAKPKIKISVTEGSIKSSRNTIDLQFDPVEIRSIYPVANSDIVTPSNKGAKVITDEAKELWLQRRRNGRKRLSNTKEAEIIRKLLTERHKGTDVPVPEQDTIRKRIKEWLDELGVAGKATSG